MKGELLELRQKRSANIFNEKKAEDFEELIKRYQKEIQDAVQAQNYWKISISTRRTNMIDGYHMRRCTTKRRSFKMFRMLHTMHGRILQWL